MDRRKLITPIAWVADFLVTTLVLLPFSLALYAALEIVSFIYSLYKKIKP